MSEGERTYWTSVEFRYLAGSEGYGTVEGGFVYAFVAATDVRSALTKLLGGVADLKLEVLRVEFVSPYEDVPWDSEAEQQRFDSLALEAGQTDEIVCDRFHAYRES